MPLAVAQSACPILSFTLSCEYCTFGANGAFEGSCATIASRYLLAIPSRQARSHGGLAPAAFAVWALATGPIASAASSTNAAIAYQLLFFNFVSLSENPASF